MNAFRWKIFVVSLRRARDRRLKVIGQLAESGLPFEIVDAVDAKHVRPELLTRAKNAWPLSDGEAACYHSHIGILERIDDYGLDFGMVLEDDFVFGNAANLTLTNIWERLPPEADHVQLHDIRDHFFKDYKVEVAEEFFNRLSCTNVPSIGYIISRKLAQHMLRCHRLPAMPIDHQFIALSRGGIFDFYDLNERLIDVDWGTPSEIRAES